MNTNVDVVVIGAGQAGLAASHALMDTGLSHVVLEAGETTGGSWPHYYDSLTLFSPARYCELPGLQMSGDRGRYPTRDEAVTYLRRYAEHFELPIRTRSRVVDVRPSAATLWEVELATGETVHARAVIAATGSFERPHRPQLRGQDRYRGRLMHVSEYRRPAEFAGQRIVVVGAGNSGIQVAVELSEVAHVTLATRAPVSFRPQRPLGIDLHYWVARSGVDRLPLGRRAASSVPVLDEGQYAAAIAAGTPDRREMFLGLTADGVEWWEGPRERVDTVILATGYRPALNYLPEAAFAADGWPLHHRGVSTAFPRLGYVGLPGQTGLASSMLRGVGPDAARVVRRLRQQLGTVLPLPVERPLVEVMS
jgi:putative flavoprotein involved in K+ transport